VSGSPSHVRTFFEEMEASSVYEERAAALRHLIEGHGFDKWALMLQIDPFSQTPHAQSNFFFEDHRDPAWADEYQTLGLSRLDPTWSASPKFLLPQFWDDIPQTDVQKRHMDRAAVDGGATNGFSVITPAPGGGGGGFSCSGRDKRAPGAVALEILSAVQIFRIYAQVEYSAAAAAKLNLTENELKLLRLHWEGYSRASIAAMEDCKEAAINQRFYEMRQRFGVEKDIQIIKLAFSVGALP